VNENCKPLTFYYPPRKVRFRSLHGLLVITQIDIEEIFISENSISQPIQKYNNMYKSTHFCTLFVLFR